jgi:hypothetical protein
LTDFRAAATLHGAGRPIAAVCGQSLGDEPMRKAMIIAVAGVLFAGNAMACGWGMSKTADSGTQQTVMTEPVKPAPGTGSGEKG